MSAATLIANAFGEGADLYAVVLGGVPRDATAAQLRKAYYRQALRCHPDKVRGREAEFQAISVAYDILKDPVKRAEYDETGELWDDQEDGTTTTSEVWKSYFEQVFGRVTVEDIDKFGVTYKCSEEEQKDVLKYYTKFEGNLIKMLSCIMLSTPRDCRRWVDDFIRPAIEKGEVEDYSETLEKTLKKCIAKADKEDDLMNEDDDEVEEEQEPEVDEDATESEDSEPYRSKNKKKKKPAAKPKVAKGKATKAKNKKKSKAQKEAEAAEELLAKMRNKHALANREAGFEAMFGSIKEKYGVTDDDPLAGDAFEKAQAKMMSKSKKKKKSK